VEPDHFNEGADPPELVRNAKLIASRFPIHGARAFDGRLRGVYDVTPDKQPVLGPIPAYRGLHADFGWSGHGFKHTPVIGDVLSDVVLTGWAPGYDLTPFRWSQFREGDLLPMASGRPASPQAAARDSGRVMMECNIRDETRPDPSGW
jgi:glycine/D-amino acid oxidase-like deaminating enzyme